MLPFLTNHLICASQNHSEADSGNWQARRQPKRECDPFKVTEVGLLTLGSVPCTKPPSAGLMLFLFLPVSACPISNTSQSSPEFSPAVPTLTHYQTRSTTASWCGSSSVPSTATANTSPFPFFPSALTHPEDVCWDMRQI